MRAKCCSNKKVREGNKERDTEIPSLGESTTDFSVVLIVFDISRASNAITLLEQPDVS